MNYLLRLAIPCAAVASLTAPAQAAPNLAVRTLSAGPIVQVQGYRGSGAYGGNVGVPGIGGFLGGGAGGFGGGFGGGGYKSWGGAPPPPTYQPPVYNTYQPPAQARAPVPAPAPAPVAAAPEPSYSDRPAARRPVVTVARPVPNAQPDYLATLSSVKGDDVGVRAGSSGSFTNISSGRQLKAGDELATGPDTEVTLTLRDGNTVQVSPATHIALAELEAKDPSKTLVSLKIGEISPKVSLGASLGASFGVKTERVSAMVRAASFTIRQDRQGDTTTVSVDGGTLVVTPTNSALQPAVLQEGQRAQVTADNIVVPTAPSDSPVVASAPDTPAASGKPSGVITVSTGAAAAAAASPPVAAGAAASDAAATPAQGAAAPPAGASPSTQVAATNPSAAVPPPATLSGSWLSQDGSTVQLTQNGNQVSWGYKGPPGHEDLVGNVAGTFDGKYFVGTFQYKEGDAVGNGTITLVLDGDKLVGGWVATAPAGSTGSSMLTRQ